MSGVAKSRARAAIVSSIAALLLSANAQAVTPDLAEPQPSNFFLRGAKASFDVVILRPLGLIGLAVGTGAFVPAALVAAPMGWDGIKPALDLFVVDPARHVFQRPLGDF
jgi:hypothetical protein